MNNQPAHGKFQQRVVQAAKAALEQNGSVGPLELFRYMGLLQPVHVEGWRKGNPYFRVLRKRIQVGPEKFQKTLRYFEEWVKQRGLRSSGRVGRSAAGRELDASAVDLAVVAHIRHAHTNYDALVRGGAERLDARAQVREKIDRVLERWREHLARNRQQGAQD